MIKNLFIVLAFALMLINPNISIAAESHVDVQEIFTSSENIDGHNFMYPKGKAEMHLIRVEVKNGATIPMHSHPIPLLGHIESGELTLAEKQALVKPSMKVTHLFSQQIRLLIQWQIVVILQPLCGLLWPQQKFYLL